MKREVPIEDLKKLYTANDMAKTGCGGCAGCCDCCCGMGESVILDPLDVHRLAEGLHTEAAALLQTHLELHPVDGVILPNLKMTGSAERCVFLSAQRRCSIHAFRPGLCRLFPLGRYYENGGFRYFLQQSECRMEPKTKVKISRWMDTPRLKDYEKYVLDWHNFLESVQELLSSAQDEQLAKELNVYILNTFFIQSYGRGADFYEQFAQRLEKTGKLMAILKREKTKDDGEQ